VNENVILQPQHAACSKARTYLVI